MKPEFVSIRFSDIPKHNWIEIVLVNPSDHAQRLIPHRTTGKETYFLSYRAYFPHKPGNVFNIVFPLKKFERAVQAINPAHRQELNRPVKFEFLKSDRGKITIRGYNYL